ncbi:hypothetical protein [Actinocatenispora rupis]|uniref:Uncharacterized protein n=1 Tax=Actinocatenispora rupis TaxID=519421 RepID=A0A8J3IWX7_9ACTN|nr:hypothetical protein [Actinocatenispora rupis]GID11501.1 hypothetical protein Aru02nite_23900 [Actinocatenispora rupis]
MTGGQQATGLIVLTGLLALLVATVRGAGRRIVVTLSGGSLLVLLVVVVLVASR